MTHHIIIQRVSKLSSIPLNKELKQWMNVIFNKEKPVEITLRIVNANESAQLNHTYRRKNKPTNVLSFVYETSPVTGDIVLCAPLIAREAHLQHKSIKQHWAHLIVHGSLHLLGYDHDTKKEAKIMENLEIKILRCLGFSNPYLTATRKDNVRR